MRYYDAYIFLLHFVQQARSQSAPITYLTAKHGAAPFRLHYFRHHYVTYIKNKIKALQHSIRVEPAAISGTGTVERELVAAVELFRQ
jgi:hypothetical protein